MCEAIQIKIQPLRPVLGWSAPSPFRTLKPIRSQVTLSPHPPRYPWGSALSTWRPSSPQLTSISIPPSRRGLPIDARIIAFIPNCQDRYVKFSLSEKARKLTALFQSSLNTSTADSPDAIASLDRVHVRYVITPLCSLSSAQLPLWIPVRHS